MKKLVTLSLMIIAGMFAVPAAEASSTAAALNAPQIRVRIGRQPRRGRRVRVTTTTRIAREGRHLFRETIRTTYFPNGRTETRVISRVRIR